MLHVFLKKKVCGSSESLFIYWINTLTNVFVGRYYTLWIEDVSVEKNIENVVQGFVDIIRKIFDSLFCK